MDLTENEIKDILENYFTQESIPLSLSNGEEDPELITIDGGYEVKLSEVLNGIIQTENDG